MAVQPRVWRPPGGGIQDGLGELRDLVQNQGFERVVCE